MNDRRGRKASDTDVLEFEDNRLVADLCGGHDEHLTRIEDALAVTISPRGNRLSLTGGAGERRRAGRVLHALYDRLQRGMSVAGADVEAALRLETAGADAAADAVEIRTPKRLVTPRSKTQTDYLRAMAEKPLVFALGPAGTGKTYLAVAYAISMMARGEVERIILSRPAVEAGERIGFLPGDMREKIDPYLRPLYDALYDVLPGEKVEKRMAAGDIEVAPLAFMRGRTLSHAFVILDEAQNAAVGQMKMFLTRLGEGSRMIVTGDPSQVDLPKGEKSGLEDAAALLKDVKDVATVRFTQADVVRHDLVKRIVDAYDRRDGQRAAKRARIEGANGDGDD